MAETRNDAIADGNDPQWYKDAVIYQVHDLIGGGRYVWHGAHNFVELNPHVLPAHIFRVRRHVRSEHDFDYFA